MSAPAAAIPRPRSPAIAGAPVITARLPEVVELEGEGVDLPTVCPLLIVTPLEMRMVFPPVPVWVGPEIEKLDIEIEGKRPPEDDDATADEAARLLEDCAVAAVIRSAMIRERIFGGKIVFSQLRLEKE